jgi:hypothetical protein
MPASREPAFEVRGIHAERDVAHAERVETARGGERGQLLLQAHEVRVHGASYTTRR